MPQPVFKTSNLGHRTHSTHCRSEFIELTRFLFQTAKQVYLIKAYQLTLGLIFYATKYSYGTSLGKVFWENHMIGVMCS